MIRNYEAFSARYTARRADWSVLAKVFSEAGLTDAAGKPAQPETARKTWQRIRQDMSRGQAGPSKRIAIATARSEKSHPDPDLALPPSVVEPEFVPEVRFSPKPAVMRSRMPKENT